jgi:hypothetical protein
MNTYFLAAGVLTFVIGLVHSVLGETMIFRRMRLQGIIPTNGGSVLREPHVRILWASWHVVTALGWCVAITLFWLALPSTAQISQSALSKAIACALLISSLLVLVGTKGKHLGWMGLLAAAALTAVGVYG